MGMIVNPFIMALVESNPTVYNEITARSPWAYYRLEETSGGSGALDSSGNARHIDFGGATQNIAGLDSVGKCWDFNGTSHYIGQTTASYAAAMDSAFGGNNQPCSMFALINLDSLTGDGRCIFLLGDGSAGREGLSIWVSSAGQVYAYFGGTPVYGASGAITTGVTYSIGFTRSSTGVVTVFVNGMQSGVTGTVAGSLNLSGTTEKIFIGMWASGQYKVDGRIDEVAVFNSDIRADGMLALHDAALSTSFVPALDSYTSGLWAARWTRRLLTSYTGNLIRVRRSSDNAEVDIGYKPNGRVNETAILAHCGMSTGYVTTIYDQSGNGRHLTQTTAASQPVICDAGVMSGVVGNTFAPRFYIGGTPAYFNDVSVSGLTAIELFGGVKTTLDPPSSSARSGHPFCYSDAVGSSSSHYPFTDGLIYDRFGSAVRVTVGNPANSLTNPHMYNARAATNDWYVWINGLENYLGLNTLTLVSDPRIGSGHHGDAHFDGLIAGSVIYSSHQASRATIRSLLLPQ